MSMGDCCLPARQTSFTAAGPPNPPASPERPEPGPRSAGSLPACKARRGSPVPAPSAPDMRSARPRTGRPPTERERAALRFRIGDGEYFMAGADHSGSACRIR
ncbi:unnamed protein product [Sphagnum balticum]